MKLSDIVACLNLLDSLDVRSECVTAVGKINHIRYTVTEHADQFEGISKLIDSSYSEISHSIDQFVNKIENFKQTLRQQIADREQEYLERSTQIYYNEYRLHSADTVLARRMGIDSEDDLRLRTHLRNITDWRMPGMILRPGLENYIEDMVPLDPLYVVDHDSELMQPAIKKFTPAYQRRLREYVINDWAPGPIMHQLPNNQFGAIFAYNYFNRKPVPIICKFLDEFFEKLRPGGVVIMTYNNCDLAHGVTRAESAWMMYTPRRMIETHAVALGFELREAYDGQGDVSWLEFKKPGDLTSLRGGQTLAKVVAKTT